MVPTADGLWPRLGDPEVRFAEVMMGGYAREPVDSLVEQCELRFRETCAQVEHVERRAADAESRVQALEADSNRSATSAAFDQLVEEVLEEEARVIESYVISQAERERQECKDVAKEYLDKARARAEEIVAEACQEREGAERALAQSRRQVDQLLDEGRVMAAGRYQVVWDKARDRLGELVREREQLGERRRMIINEVMELTESVQLSWRRVIQ
jgi:hypothetical protein